MGHYPRVCHQFDPVGYPKRSRGVFHGIPCDQIQSHGMSSGKMVSWIIQGYEYIPWYLMVFNLIPWVVEEISRRRRRRDMRRSGK